MPLRVFVVCIVSILSSITIDVYHTQIYPAYSSHEIHSTIQILFDCSAEFHLRGMCDVCDRIVAGWYKWCVCVCVYSHSFEHGWFCKMRGDNKSLKQLTAFSSICYLFIHLLESRLLPKNGHFDLVHLCVCMRLGLSGSLACYFCFFIFSTASSVMLCCCCCFVVARVCMRVYLLM